MCDKELLVSYVYDEVNGPDKKAFQQHLSSCRECQDEVQLLRGTRGHLGAWRIPEPPLGLGVHVPAAAASRFRVSRTWGLAAAAALVLAAAAAIANLEVRAGADGLTIRTGWSARPVAAPAAPTQDLAAIQQRIHELETALAAVQPTAAVAATAAAAAVPVRLASGPSHANRLSDAEVLRRVRQWIDESERRQEQTLAVRLVQGMREMQAAHASDLVRLQQSIDRSQGIWNDEVFRQREEMKQFYRIVNAQQQR